MSSIPPSAGSGPSSRDPTPAPPPSPLAPVPSWLEASLAARLDSAVALNEELRRRRQALLGQRRGLIAARRALLSDVGRALGQSPAQSPANAPR